MKPTIPIHFGWNTNKWLKLWSASTCKYTYLSTAPLLLSMMYSKMANCIHVRVQNVLSTLHECGNAKYAKTDSDCQKYNYEVNCYSSWVGLLWSTPYLNPKCCLKDAEDQFCSAIPQFWRLRKKMKIRYKCNKLRQTPILN